MVAHTFIPNPTLERQRQADFWVRGQSGIHSEFQDSQTYTEKPCLETKQNKKRFVLHVLVFFLHVWMFSKWTPGVQEGQMEFSGFRKLELQIISSHHVGVQNRVLIGAHYWGANSSAHGSLLISSWANMLVWSYLTHYLFSVYKGQHQPQTLCFLFLFRSI